MGKQSKVNEMVRNYFKINPAADRETLIEMIKDVVILPTKETLSRKYLANKVNAAIRQITNEKGERIVFSYSEKGVINYASINGCDVEKIDKLLQSFRKEVKTKQSNIKRLQFAKKILEGQLAMDFIEQERQAIAK